MTQQSQLQHRGVNYDTVNYDNYAVNYAVNYDSKVNYDTVKSIMTVESIMTPRSQL